MRKIVITGSIANSLEWYDFALYAHFASILGKKFFPEFDSNAALLATLSVFAVGFLMRPLGAIIFGVIGDKYGRKTSLSLAILFMSIPTALVGVLPDYETIGVAAPVILCLLRLVQGLSLGGALISSASYIVEHAKPKHRGLVGSASMFSLCFGFMLGSLVAWLFARYMSPENFVAFGWRIPFLFGLVAMVVSYYLKHYAEESPEFSKAKDEGLLIEKPLKKLFKSYKLTVLASIAINALGSVGFYTLAVFIGRYLENARGMQLAEISILESCIMVVVMLSVVAAGALSDLIGQRRWFMLVAIATIIAIFPIIYFIEHGSYGAIFASQFVFALLVGSWIGPEPSFQMSMYPTNVRNTGVALSYNMGCAMFGGTAPAISQYFFELSEDINFVIYYIAIVALVGLLTLLKIPQLLKKSVL